MGKNEEVTSIWAMPNTPTRTWHAMVSRGKPRCILVSVDFKVMLHQPDHLSTIIKAKHADLHVCSLLKHI